MRNSLQWGSWVFVWAACACSAGAQKSEESASVGVRSSALVPTVGPEIGTDAPVLVQTDQGHNPVVASDGNGFLAVQEVNSRIRAVRVDANGKVLDFNWLDLGEATEEQYYPSVAFGAGHYLVTWSAFGAESKIRGRFVRPDGTVEGTSAFTLTSGQGLYPSVGWTGSQFLVSWLGLGETETAVTVAAFDATGSEVANSEHTVSNGGSLSYPRIAVGSRRALVTWEKYTHDDETGDIGRIYGALVDTSGTPVGSGEFALSNSTSSGTTASVAAAGSHFLVVWNTMDDPTSIFGSSIDDNGVFDNEDVTISRSPATVGLASVAFNGTDYLVAWTDARDERSIYGTPVSTTGVVQGSADIQLATGKPRYVGFGSDRTALAWSGSKYLLSFLGTGIEGSLIGADLQLQNGKIGLTAVPNPQGYPVLVYNGTDYVVQWTDERDGYNDMSVRAVRISQSGQVRDPNGIVLSTPDSTAFSHALGSTGSGSALSLWAGTGVGNHRRTLAADGTLGALTPFGSEELNSPPAVASDGTGYLAAYFTGDWNAGVIAGQLVDASGNGGSEFTIVSPVSSSPSVFPAAGGGYLVGYTKGGTRLIPVSSTGEVGADFELSANSSQVTAVTGANKTLVAWTDYNESLVHARFFEAGALTGDTLEIGGSSYVAALAWDGESFFAVWETAEHQLFGRNIATDGTLGPVTTLVDEGYGPVTASNGQGQVLLSYIRYTNNFWSRRITSRVLGAIVEGGGGSAGSAGAAGSAGSAGSAGATGGPGGSGGSLGTAGSGTAGSGTAGTTGTAGSGTGGGSQPPIVINCSVTRAGDKSSNATLALGSVLVALAGVLARRRRRIAASH